MCGARNLQAYKKWLIVLLMFLATFGLGPATANALAQVITLTPTSVSPVIQPGGTYKGSFQILDQGDSSYKFLTYPTPYRVSGEDYTPEFTFLPSAPDVGSWLNFSIPGGNLKPGQTVTVDYTISVPVNTQPGGYYAAAFAETQIPTKANSVALNERVGELFYIQVAGPVVKKGSLLTWKSGILQKPPLTSTIRIQDSGSIHFPAKITYVVEDTFGHPKYTLNTDKELLPQTIRRITLPWKKSPSIGLFRVKGSVNILGQTHNLPTKWVLVMSSTMRIAALVLMALILFYLAIVRPRLSGGKRARDRRRYEIS